MTTYVVCPLLGALAGALRAQNDHADHLATGTFGKVHFETSCDATVRAGFRPCSRDAALVLLSGNRARFSRRHRERPVVRDGVLGCRDQSTAESVDGAVSAGALAAWLGSDSTGAHDRLADTARARMDRRARAVLRERATRRPAHSNRKLRDRHGRAARAVPRRQRGRSVLCARAARGGRPHGQDLLAAAKGRSDSRALASATSRSTPVSPTTSFTRTTTRRLRRKVCRRPASTRRLRRRLRMRCTCRRTSFRRSACGRKRFNRTSPPTTPIAVMPPARTRPWLRRLRE